MRRWPWLINAPDCLAAAVAEAVERVHAAIPKSVSKQSGLVDCDGLWIPHHWRQLRRFTTPFVVPMWWNWPPLDPTCLTVPRWSSLPAFQALLSWANYWTRVTRILALLHPARGIPTRMLRTITISFYPACASMVVMSVSGKASIMPVKIAKLIPAAATEIWTTIWGCWTFSASAHNPSPSIGHQTWITIH